MCLPLGGIPASLDLMLWEQQQYAVPTTCVLAVIVNIVAEAPQQDVSCAPKVETVRVYPGHTTQVRPL
jgi:hypothetical protein